MNHLLQAPNRRRSSAAAATLMMATAIMATGCTSFTQPIDGVPADRLPSQFFAPPKNDLVPVDISLLSIEPPRDYLVGGGDILGIYVEGVMPFSPPNEPPEPPPVNFPDENSTLPPSIGFPIPVQDDGTLSLPLIEPLPVENLTIDQVRDAIREAYIDAEILISERARPIVTLIKERTYDVIVVREDDVATARAGGNSETIRGGSDRSASGGLIRLPAYQNDVLHALVETGGLPGLNAKNEVKILRASQQNQQIRAESIRRWAEVRRRELCKPCGCPPPLPDDPTVLRIPLRLPPGVVPSIRPEDIRLEDGDIVYIESRETEVFYTGGLLEGGEYLLPRDYDLDVLGAIAIAGGTVAGTARQSGGGFGRGFDGVPPGLLYILRDNGCGGQIAIEVDLAEALNDPNKRPLVQAGDTLILQYKCEEQLINYGVSTFFTFGIAELLRN